MDFANWEEREEPDSFGVECCQRPYVWQGIHVCLILGEKVWDGKRTSVWMHSYHAGFDQR